MIIDWYTITLDAVSSLWTGFLAFLPKLIGAIIIFVIGWFISLGIGKLVAEILKRLQFNRIFEKGNWKEAMAKAGFKVDASGFIGAIVKWVLAIAFLLAAVEVLGLNQFADFLGNVLAYLPNVVIAALIFVVAVIIADILEKVVRVGAEGMKMGYGQVAGAIVRWAIWIFAILAILIQLEIASELVLTIVTGFIALIALAGGIAFGLGGKDAAAEAIDSLRRKLKG